jgi:hypothetical protein
MKGGLVALALLPLASAAAPSDRAAPYRILQEANARLDPQLATSAYASDALLLFEYPGRPGEAFRGHDAIRSSYVRTFGQVDKGAPIKLAFRFEQPGLTSDNQAGVYRIDATVGGRPITIYGRFSAKLVMEGGAWRFAQDRGTPAAAADFERLPPTDPSSP